MEGRRGGLEGDFEAAGRVGAVVTGGVGGQGRHGGVE